MREFKDRPVAKETLEALLDVARRAPTASNSQKLHWIVVNDGAKVRALSAEAMNWLRTADIAPGKVGAMGQRIRFYIARRSHGHRGLHARGLWVGKTGLRHCPDLSGIGGGGPRLGRLLGRLPDPRSRCSCSASSGVIGP